MPGFSSTYSPLFLALFLIISAAASYFFYRNSILSAGKKYFLIAIKTLAIFLLLALFIEPALSKLVAPENNRLDIVLVDNSRSNLFSSKNEQIRKILTDGNLFGSEYRIFTFSNGVNTLEASDSLVFSGYETDLSAALRNIRNSFPDRNFNSVTIISDGIYTSGGNPLYEAKTFQAPFITVPVGDSIQIKDIVISSVSYNEKAFTNIPSKIKVSLGSYDFPAGVADVNFYRENNLISSKQVNLTGSNTYETDFDITENSPGKFKYRIEAAGREGELTLKNNYSDFYITFIDNKVNVLVISGAPGYDDSFITGVLKRINNYNITFRTAKSPGDFYEGAIDEKSFPELSALFLLNYPTTQTASNIVSSITDKVKTFRIPVIFFAGKNSDFAKLQAFEESLPFSVSRPNSGESLFNLQVVASADNLISKLNEVNSTAQIFRNVSGIIPKPGALTVATDKFSGEPVMLTRTSGDIKSTAFLGYGLWRWKLNSSSNAEKTLEKFLIETINITLQKDKKTKFRVYPAKDIFDYSEPVKIYAEALDESYLPTRNAIVSGRILRKDGSKIADLKFSAEENKYSAYSEKLPYGDYFIEADAELNGTFYGKDNSRFSTDTINTEYLVTKSNMQLLRELSFNTGGESLQPGRDLKQVIARTENKNMAEVSLLKTVKFNLWENKWILGLIILLFALEWAFRKRNNIP